MVTPRLDSSGDGTQLAEQRDTRKCAFTGLQQLSDFGRLLCLAKSKRLDRLLVQVPHRRQFDLACLKRVLARSEQVVCRPAREQAI